MGDSSEEDFVHIEEEFAEEDFAGLSIVLHLAEVSDEDFASSDPVLVSDDSAIRPTPV